MAGAQRLRPFAASHSRRRHIAWLIALALIAGACGGGGDEAATTEPTTSAPAGTESAAITTAAPTTSTAATTAAPASSTAAPASSTTVASGPSATLQDIVQRGVVRVGTGRDVDVFRTGVASGTPTGFEVELAAAVAEVLAPRAAVEFMEVASALRFDAMAAGEYDMLVSLTVHTLAREESALFTQPYLVGGPAVVVNADAGVSSVADLEGKSIVVFDGPDLAALNEALTAAGVIATVAPVAPGSILEDALATGTDGAAMSYPAAVLMLDRNGSSFEIVPVDVLSSPVSIAVARGNEAFQQEVNAALGQVIADGTWLQLFEKYIGTPPFTADELASVGPS